MSICLHCLKDFFPYKGDQKYCSKQCRDIQYKRIIRGTYIREFNCRECGGKCTSTKKNQKTCFTCIKKYSRSRYRKYDNRKINYEQKVIIEKKRRVELSKSYVVSILIKNGIKTPTSEQIEQKRLSIKLKRKIYEIERKTKSQGNHGRPNDVLP